MCIGRLAWDVYFFWGWLLRTPPAWHWERKSRRVCIGEGEFTTPVYTVYILCSPDDMRARARTKIVASRVNREVSAANEAYICNKMNFLPRRPPPNHKSQTPHYARSSPMSFSLRSGLSRRSRFPVLPWYHGKPFLVGVSGTAARSERHLRRRGNSHRLRTWLRAAGNKKETFHRELAPAKAAPATAASAMGVPANAPPYPLRKTC